MTRPKNQDPHTAVVFVAGSGPTDRDWCSPLLPGKNGSAKLLAEELATRGILTLRYDKRASGPHVKENIPKMMGKISMQSHMEELSGAVRKLISEKYADEGNLFVFTNSEGAIHALNYQLQEDAQRFKGLVLTGAPGRAISQVARTQAYNAFASLPNSETIMKHYDEAISAFVAGKPVVPDTSIPDGFKMLLLGLSTPANLPFAREFWVYDPSQKIAKVREPMLVVIGKKDIQVDWQIDGKALEAAKAKEGNATFVYPKYSDHVLKHEERPKEELRASEVGLRYNAEDRIIDGETVEKISNWIQSKL